MRTFIGSYDLSSPQPYVWGTEGYDRVMLLLRLRDQPFEVVFFGHDPQSPAITREKIEEVLLYTLGIHHFVHAEFTRSCHDSSSAGELPAISVIVCSRERPTSLTRCLTALMEVDYPNFEVVVVDNASRSQETADVVNSTPFRYARENRPGLNWARNCGIGTAKHDILAFTDDDVKPDPCWLRGVARGFANPRIMAVTGLVLPAELETSAQHHFENYGGMGKGMHVKDFIPANLGARALIRSQDVGVGANMAFRRDLFDAVGEFDTALDVGTPSGGGGDLDMLHRVLAANYQIRYEPYALVWHFHRRDMTGLKRQLYNNGRSYGVYLIKRWRDRELGHRSLASFILGSWVPWLVGRLFLVRHPLPFALRWAEFWGATHSMWAYLRTYRNDGRVRKQRASAQEEIAH